MAACDRVRVIDSSDEFRPRKYRVNVFGLGKYGVPCVPVIGHKVCRDVQRASPWHAHKNVMEFNYCTAGACEYESEGRLFSMTPGMMFVSQPREAHRQLSCPKGYSTYYMQFRPSADRSVRWFADEFAGLPRLFPCSRSLAMRFAGLLALAEREDFSTGMSIRIQMSLWALLFDILDSAAVSVRRKVPDAVGEIAKRMQAHPERDYPLDGIVAEAGVSKASFISLFKAAHGLTPHAYLLHCRIEKAKGLLEGGVSVSTVSDAFGFSTPQHFTRTFKSFVGITPRSWLSGKRA